MTPLVCTHPRMALQTNIQVVADVWKKDVWEFQAKSGSSGSWRLFLHFLGRIRVQEMSGKTPGSPRRPSSRHPRPYRQKMIFGLISISQRARGSKKFILARTHEKIILPRTKKCSFSLEIFILGLKISFPIENFNPRPCFSAAREGPGMKISFSIENFILYWKLDFFNIASRDWIFSILGPSGFRCRCRCSRKIVN